MDDTKKKELNQQISDLWDHDDPDNPPNNLVLAARMTKTLQLMREHLSEDEFERFFKDFLGVMADHWKDDNRE